MHEKNASPWRPPPLLGIPVAARDDVRIIVGPRSEVVFWRRRRSACS
jgi:hypothetical protein